jgi:hypothetical protein
MENEINNENNPTDYLKNLPVYQTILFLQVVGLLIRRSMARCKDNCKHKSTGIKRRLQTGRRTKSSTNTLYQFRCSTCRRETTLFKNSFFSIFVTPFTLVLDVIKYWCANVTISKTRRKMAMDGNKMHRTTIGAIFRRVRNVASLALDKANIKLGGRGLVVEIDESLFVRVKYNKGKDLRRKQVWVFGMVCRTTNKCFFTIVPNRRAETLLPIIYDHCLPGVYIEINKYYIICYFLKVSFKKGPSYILTLGHLMTKLVN